MLLVSGQSAQVVLVMVHYSVIKSYCIKWCLKKLLQLQGLYKSNSLSRSLISWVGGLRFIWLI